MENSKELIKEFWDHVSLSKRVSSYRRGEAVIRLSNTNDIKIQIPNLENRFKEVDRKLNKLLEKVGKEKWDEYFKKYSAVHGIEYEASIYGRNDKKNDKRCEEIIELLFNILYGELLSLEQEALKALDDAEKGIDEDLKKFD